MSNNGTSHANSNGSGPGTGTRGKLVRLLAEHEQIAAAIRVTLGLLDGHEVEKKQRRAPDVISQAIALDAARRGKATRKSKPKPYNKAAIKVRRARTLKILDALSTTTPRPFPAPSLRGGLGTLLRHGLIKKSGDGYVRTAKPFTV